MAVVLEKQIGNTRAIIRDDYCKDMTPAAVEEILRRIAQRALSEFSAATAEHHAEVEISI